MACVCSQYTVTCPLIGQFWSIILTECHGPIMGLQNESKKPYNKQLINLKHLVFTGKSQTSALPYTARSRFEIFP